MTQIRDVETMTESELFERMYGPFSVEERATAKQHLAERIAGVLPDEMANFLQRIRCDTFVPRHEGYLLRALNHGRTYLVNWVSRSGGYVARRTPLGDSVARALA